MSKKKSNITKLLKNNIHYLSPSSYDRLTYSSKPFPKTHPGYIHSILNFCDLKAPALENAKVLEIGCSFGGNILPLAEMYPNMEVVGVDMSSVQIETGKKIIAETGLTNIKLIAADITQCDLPENYFDYIICHGVWSWVPEFVKDGIFEVINRCLNNQGVAFVSYNTYPGWKTGEIVRDAMLLTDDRNLDDMTRYKKAMDMLDFLWENIPQNTPFRKHLETDYKYLKKHDAHYIVHEYLEEHNEPCYFWQFNDRLNKFGLRHLIEADFLKQLCNYGFNKERVARIQDITSYDYIKQEQLKDFLYNNRFRQSIITKIDNFNDMQDKTTPWLNLHIQGVFTQVKKEDGTIGYQSNNEFLSEDPTLYFIADKLFHASPNTLPVKELYEEFLATNPKIDNFFYWLVNLVGEFRITIRSTPIMRNKYKEGEKPLISKTQRAVAQYNLTNQDAINVTSAFHLAVKFSFAQYFLITHCNGENTLDDLIEIHLNGVTNGVLTINNNKGEDLSSIQLTDLKSLLRDHILSSLKQFEFFGLLLNH